MLRAGEELPRPSLLPPISRGRGRRQSCDGRPTLNSPERGRREGVVPRGTVASCPRASLTGYKASPSPSLLTTATPRRASRKRAVWFGPFASGGQYLFSLTPHYLGLYGAAPTHGSRGRKKRQAPRA